MKEPIVSIVIPCFNSAKTIFQTIESCLDQDYDALQIIVVDDNSADESFAIVEELSRQDKRITLTKNPGKGAQSARNYGLSKVIGEYIKFLDSDDIISESLIGNQVKLLRGKTKSVAICEWQHFEQYPGDLASFERPTDRDYYSITEFFTELWSSGMYPPHAWLLPREIITPRDKWDERLTQNQDGEFFSRIVSKANAILFADGVAYYRKPNGLHTSQKRGAIQIQSQFIVLQSYMQVYRRLGKSPLLLDSIRMQIFTVAYRAATNLEEMDYLENGIQMLAQVPSDKKPRFPSRALTYFASVFGVKNTLFLRSIITRLQHHLFSGK